MTNSRAGAGKYKMSLEQLLVAKRKEVLKKVVEACERHKSQSEGASTGLRWDS